MRTSKSSLYAQTPHPWTKVHPSARQPHPSTQARAQPCPCRAQLQSTQLQRRPRSCQLRHLARSPAVRSLLPARTQENACRIRSSQLATHQWPSLDINSRGPAVPQKISRRLKLMAMRPRPRRRALASLWTTPPPLLCRPSVPKGFLRPRRAEGHARQPRWRRSSAGSTGCI